MFLTPNCLISFKKKDKLYIILISIIIITLGGLFCAITGFIPFILLFLDFAEISNEIALITRIFLFLLFFLNYGIFYLIIEGMVRLIYNKKENSLNFFISFGIVMAPMVIYLGLHVIWFELMDILFIGILDRILLIFFQVWSLWLLIYNLSINKELELENGLIISLLLHYGSFSIILFTLI